MSTSARPKRVKKPKAVRPTRWVNVRFIVGLDLSLTGTGLVVIDHMKNVILRKCIKTPSYMTSYDRVDAIVAKVTEELKGVLSQADPSSVVFCLEDFVAVRGFARQNTGATSVRMELAGVLKFLFRLEGYEVYVAGNRSLKKFMTGNGSSEKQEMIHGLFVKHGLHTSDHNVADAFAAAFFMHAYLFDRAPLNVIKQSRFTQSTAHQ